MNGKDGLDGVDIRDHKSVRAAIEEAEERYDNEYPDELEAGLTEQRLFYELKVRIDGLCDAVCHRGIATRQDVAEYVVGKLFGEEECSQILENKEFCRVVRLYPA